MMSTLVQERKNVSVREANDASRVEEVMAFCPRCKALQTVWLNGDTLKPTLKFIQVGSHIYHNCGATQPCRLYFSS
jgi:hypothetical protein